MLQGITMKLTALAVIVLACVDPVPIPPIQTCTSLQRYGFCTEWIPWDNKEFHEADLPRVDPAVTITVTSAAQLCQQMKLGARTLVIPTGTTIGSTACGGRDIELIISAGAGLSIWYPSTDYPAQGAPKFSTRVRVRGPGQLGAMMVLKTTGTGAGHNSDLIFDGLRLTPHALNVDKTSEPIFNINDDVSRLVIVNNVARTGASSTGGASFLLAGGNDFLIAGNNIDILDASGPGNNWAIRLSSSKADGSMARYIIADNRFDSGGEQAIFRQGGNGTITPHVDHTFLRNNVFVSATTPLVIKDENGGTTDETYGDLNTIIFSGGSESTVNFAAHSGSTALSKKWIITNTTWKSTNSAYISDGILLQFMDQCPIGTLCQYIVGNKYIIDPVFSNLLPPWATIHSPLTGTDVGSDPALLP